MKISKKELLRQVDKVWESVRKDKRFSYKSKDEYIQEVLDIYKKVRKEGAGYYEKLRDNFIKHLKQQEELIKMRLENKRLLQAAENKLKDRKSE